jgi:hypothetical protein
MLRPIRRKERVMSIGKVSLFVAVVVGITAGSAYADERIMRVKVPFEFSVQGHVMPAGTYDIQAGTDGPEVIWIMAASKHGAVSIALTTPEGVGHNPSGHEPTLVFTPDERHPRLSEIWESNGEGFLIHRR